MSATALRHGTISSQGEVAPSPGGGGGGGSADTQPPTTPTIGVVSSPANTSGTLRVPITTQSTDNVGVTEYGFRVGGVETQRVPPNRLSVDFANLTNGTTYFFEVVAYDAAGNRSAVSNTRSAIPVDNVAPSPPTFVVVTAGAAGSGQATVAFTAGTDTHSPPVTHRAVVDGVERPAAITSGVVLTGLTVGTHQVIVRAYDSAATPNFTNSATVSVVIPGTPPPTGGGGAETALFVANFEAYPVASGTQMIGQGKTYRGLDIANTANIAIESDPQEGRVMRISAISGQATGGSAGIRTEVWQPQNSAGTVIDYPIDSANSDWWMGVRYKANASAFPLGASIMQWKSDGGTLDTNAWGGFIYSHGSGFYRARFGNVQLWQSPTTIAATAGQWLDFIVRTRLTTPTGVFEIWFGPAGSAVKQTLTPSTGPDPNGPSIGTTYNGKLVFGIPGNATSTNYPPRLYGKRGIYGGNKTSTNYWSQDRIGHSFNDVAPR